MTSSAEDYLKKNKRREKKETKLRIITNHFYLFFSHLVITTRPVEILSHYSGLSLAVSLIHKMTKDKKRGGDSRSPWNEVILKEEKLSQNPP